MAQCLKTTGTANPLVLIDEIDKLGRGDSVVCPDVVLVEVTCCVKLCVSKKSSHADGCSMVCLDCRSCRLLVLCAEAAAWLPPILLKLLD